MPRYPNTLLLTVHHRQSHAFKRSAHPSAWLHGQRKFPVDEPDGDGSFFAGGNDGHLEIEHAPPLGEGVVGANSTPVGVMVSIATVTHAQLVAVRLMKKGRHKRKKNGEVTTTGWFAVCMYGDLGGGDRGYRTFLR